MALAHVRRGSGPPLVLIHGIGSQWQMWRPVLDRVSREREVVAVDLPGFGDSAPLPGRPTVEALAGAVAEFLDGLGLAGAHAAGNSLGGGNSRQSARAQRLLPGARHVVLTGCGHVPTWDDPEQVARVLLDASAA